MGDVGLYNVVVMGIAFLCMFGAFQTSTFIEATVLHSDAKLGNGDRIAFVSVSIIYFVFAFANSFAPALVSLLGSKYGMFFGAIPYCLFIGCIIYPIVPVLFACSALLGIGAAVLWTAQGEFLTSNSTEETMSRNTGIFWALLQSSLVVGNGAVYFVMGDASTISDRLRTKLYGILTCACTLGTLLLLILRKPPQLRKDYSLSLSTSGQSSSERPSPIKAIGSMLKLLRTKDMLLLAVCFSYTGLELTFFSGVYGTMIGNMADVNSTVSVAGEALLSDYTNGVFKKNQILLAGILVGVGEILGGLVFGILGKRTIKYGRDPIVVAGLVIHVATYYIIYLNMLPRTPFDQVGFQDLVADHDRLWRPSVPVALFCAFSLGLGDSLFNTQMYGIISALYSDDSAPAFSLFKFFQSFFAGIAFIYTSYIVLRYQLMILTITGIMGTYCFVTVEWSLKHRQDGYRAIQ
eukprot:scpid73283/ scgid31298/ UNC93-like protein MFSD11; Major facilitator superfamily domain-containing protein 11; Protein ET